MAFTTDNTAGYTATELAELNDELAARLRFIPDWDTDTKDAIAKAFADEVANRA